jgi:hypothetical protein
MGTTRRGLEGAAIAVKIVKDANSNTNAALSISRFERYVNTAVFFIWFLFGYKGTRAQPFFAKHRASLDIVQPWEPNRLRKSDRMVS